MDLGADMMRDEADDALAVGRRQLLAGVGKAFGQPVDPEPPVGVEHHLDDRGVFQEPGDGRPERGAQHARAARDRLRLLVKLPPRRPRSAAGRTTCGPGSGMSRRGRNRRLATSLKGSSYSGVERQGNGGTDSQLGYGACRWPPSIRVCRARLRRPRESPAQLRSLARAGGRARRRTPRSARRPWRGRPPAPAPAAAASWSARSARRAPASRRRCRDRAPAAMRRSIWSRRLVDRRLLPLGGVRRQERGDRRLGDRASGRGRAGRHSRRAPS